MSASKLTIFVMVAFLVGVLLGSGNLSRPSLYIYFLTAASLVWGYRKQKAKLGLGYAVFLAGSMMAGWLYVSQWRLMHYASYDPEKTHSFTGLIVAAPDTRADKVFLTVKPDTPIGRSYSGTPKAGLLLVKAPRYPAYRYGDRIRIEGAIKSPEAFSSFNYPLFLERFGIYGQVDQPKKIRLVQHNRGNFLLAGLYGLRQNLEKQIQKTISEPESSFLGGILLGSKRAIPQDIQDSLKATGTSHIIAISGANITILLTILLQIAPLTRRTHQWLAISGIGLFVTVLTGASASVLRGALVAALGSFLKIYSRRAWATPFLLLSMTVLILGNPLLLAADPGFQLSFAAFAGLAYFASPLKDRMEAVDWIKSWPEVAKGSCAETLAATLGTAFLSFKLFGQLSLTGLIVNPLILWLLPAITLLGLVAVTLGWVPGLLALIKIPLWLLLHTVLGVIRWFGNWNLGIIRWHPSWLLSFGLVAILIPLFHTIKPNKSAYAF